MDRVPCCHLCDSHWPVWIHTISAELRKLHKHHLSGFPIFWSFAARHQWVLRLHGFPLRGISMKHLHGVSRGEQLLTITAATDSLNALKSLQPGSGLSPWLWYVQIFTINVDKYLDGLLSKLMDDAKMVSTMNMIMRESGHKKSRMWDKYNTVKF